MILALWLMACEHDPISVEPTDNGDVPVGVLFTKDGCTVYRFKDGDYHYYVVCDNGQAATMDKVTCGENCFKVNETPTVTR